ncbi:MAG: TIM barrel protein, partial [Candidatus Aenigmarchaeota archaeon]
MLFGATLWYGHFREKGLKGVEDWLKRVKGMGFDYVEFTPDYPLLKQLEPVRLQQFKELLESTGLKIAIHVPWDLWLADPREDVSEGSLQVVEKCMDLGKELDTLYILTHISMQQPLGLATLRFPEVKDDVIKTAVDVAGRISSMGDERSIPTLLE